uniref:Dynamin-type G domain-containing protein n=1 Tax=Panagrellus redivivus TaxID=6233 RepID=A0A7E4ZWM2_PANRE
MSGTLPHINGAGDTRGRRHDSQDPLKRFTDAKLQMRDIYKDLEECVVDLSKFYHAEGDDDSAHKFVPAKEIAEVARFKESILTIKEMFNRDKMKVVFFGRTSNGKSTVINSMLHSKVLPQGMGHTTACFLQVEGGSENERMLQIEGSDAKRPFAELHNLGHALSSGNSATSALGTNALVTVLYPKASSKLLQNDVVLVDSPGVDLSPEFDSWIDKHCLDADVFVLVCNSESTLTQAEKNFFLRVAKRLSRPNVFILNNRWDASSSEPEQQIEQVRNQHMQRFIHFLVDELKSCTALECKDRVFFISAREVLEHRLKDKGDVERAYEQDGYPRRAKEFTSFETSFERCISKSAIRTKFEAHDRRAREIISDMRDNLDAVTNLATREKQRLKLNFELKNREFLECRKAFADFEHRYREQQQRIRQEVHLKVSADFHEEIERLEAIIDRFNMPFNDDPDKIAEFKHHLAVYVDKCVTEDLQDKCSGGLMARIWQLENDLYQNVSEIIGTEYVKNLEGAWRYKQPFKFVVTINVPKLVEDFYEDLEFKFSLGLTAIYRKLLAYKTGRPITAIGGLTLPYQQQHAAHNPQYHMANPNMHPNFANADNDDAVVTMLMNAAVYMANGGVGLAIAGVLIYQNVGWKVIAGGGAIYGGLYALERFRWNAAAKEQHLKDQFRSHLALRMKQVGNVHTAQCEGQVVSELEGVHTGLRDVVGGVHQEMKSNLDTIQRGVDRVQDFLKGVVSIKNKSSFLNTSLEAFATKFLAPDSP